MTNIFLNFYTLGHTFNVFQVSWAKVKLIEGLFYDITSFQELFDIFGFTSNALMEILDTHCNISNSKFTISKISCLQIYWFLLLHYTNNLQGDPNQSFPFQMAVTLKLSSSDPMLVKPKCVWEVAVFLKNCK